MEQATMVMTSLNPGIALIERALLSAESFDSLLVHLDAACEPPVRLSELRAPSHVHSVSYPRHLSGPQATNILCSHVVTEWVSMLCDDDDYIPENLKLLIERIHNGEYKDVDVIQCQCLVNGEQAWGAMGPVSLEQITEYNLIPASSFYDPERGGLSRSGYVARFTRLLFVSS